MNKKVKVKYVGGNACQLETEFGPPLLMEPGETYELPAVVAESLKGRRGKFEIVSDSKPPTTKPRSGKQGDK